MTSRASERGLADASEAPDRHRLARGARYRCPEVGEHVLAPDEVVGRHGRGRRRRASADAGGPRERPVVAPRDATPPTSGRPLPVRRCPRRRASTMSDRFQPSRRERSRARWTGVSGTASGLRARASRSRPPSAAKTAARTASPRVHTAGPSGTGTCWQSSSRKSRTSRSSGCGARPNSSSVRNVTTTAARSRNRRRVSVTAAVVIRDPASRRCVHARGRPARRSTAGRPGRTPRGPEPRSR